MINISITCVSQALHRSHELCKILMLHSDSSPPLGSTGLHMLHDVGLHECAHLKFTVSGRSKQA